MKPRVRNALAAILVAIWAAILGAIELLAVPPAGASGQVRIDYPDLAYVDALSMLSGVNVGEAVVTLTFAVFLVLLLRSR